MKDLKVRTITAVILIAILIPVVFFGGIFITIPCALFSILATYELEKMYKKEDKWSFHSIYPIVMSGIAYFALYIALYNYLPLKESVVLEPIFNAAPGLRSISFSLILLLGLFLVNGAIMIFDDKTNIDNMSKSLLSIFYPAIGFVSLSTIRNYESGLYREGLFILLYAVIICFMTDVFAYFFGSKFGKHKLSPISPKKSIEGSIAGTVFALVIGSAFAILSGVHVILFPYNLEVWQIILTIILTLLLSVIDEIGDLFASKLKRYYGIKDYSNLFPGHGGILDRFDSYIFVATMILFILLI